MPSSPSRPRRAALAASLALPLALSLAACGDPAAPPPRVREVFIPPIGGTLAIGITAQLRAQVVAEPGADTTLRWTNVPSPAGQVTPSGVLTTCHPGGVLTVVATSVADPTKSDTARLSVAVAQPGWAFPSGLARPGAGTPPRPTDFVDPASMNGEIEVTVSINASLLARGCRAVQRVELRLAGAARDTTFAVLESAPPFADDRTVRARLRTTAVPNGDYVLTGGVYMTGLTAPEPVTPLRVTVRN